MTKVYMQGRSGRRSCLFYFLDNGGITMKNIYAYCRVSCREQNEDRQLITMRQ